MKEIDKEYRANKALFQNEAALNRFMKVRRDEANKSILKKYEPLTVEDYIASSIIRSHRHNYSRGHEVHTPGETIPLRPYGASPVITRIKTAPGSQADCLASLHSPISNASRIGGSIKTKEELFNTMSPKEKSRHSKSRSTIEVVQLSGRIDKPVKLPRELTIIQVDTSASVRRPMTSPSPPVSLPSSPIMKPNKEMVNEIYNNTAQSPLWKKANISMAVDAAIASINVNNTKASFQTAISNITTNSNDLNYSSKNSNKVAELITDEKHHNEFYNTVQERTGVYTFKNFFIDPHKVTDKVPKEKLVIKPINTQPLINIDINEDGYKIDGNTNKKKSKRSVYRQKFFNNVP
jgi:hypothetical protein